MWDKHSVIIISVLFLKKKRREYCNRLVRPSVCTSVLTNGPLLGILKYRNFVCPLCYLLLNHWMKFNQIWCVRYSHEWSVQRHFSALPSWTLGRGQKVKYHLISITKSRFLYQTVCVFSQKKNKKHIGRNFYSVAWVTHQGWNFGRWVCPGGHFLQKR